MERFKASTHYGDWAGTVAADNHNPGSAIRQHLAGKKLINEGEHLIGLSLGHGESHGKEIENFRVIAFLFTGMADYDNIPEALDNIQGPLPVRKVILDLSLREFMTLFKRFQLVLTRKQLNLEGREYQDAH